MPTKRSYDFWLVAYYLSRFGWQDDHGVGHPPKLLKVVSWREAYRIFYSSLGGARSIRQFHNSLKNARDSYDAYIESSDRVGWRKGDDHSIPANLITLAQQVFSDWHDKPESALYEHVCAHMGSEYTEVPLPIPESVVKFELDAFNTNYWSPQGTFGSLSSYDDVQDLVLVIFDSPNGQITAESMVLALVTPEGNVVSDLYSDRSRIAARYIKLIKSAVGLDTRQHMSMEPNLGDASLYGNRVYHRIINGTVSSGYRSVYKPINAINIKMLYERVLEKFNANLTQGRLIPMTDAIILMRQLNFGQNITHDNFTSGEVGLGQTTLTEENIINSLLPKMVELLPAQTGKLVSDLLPRIFMRPNDASWNKCDFRSESRRVFDLFDERWVSVALARDGIYDYENAGFGKLKTIPTLQNLADKLDLTRERVRQLQGRISKDLSTQNKFVVRKNEFLILWLTETIKRRLNPVINLDDIDDLLYRFISRQYDVSVWEIADIGLGIIGIPKPDNCETHEDILDYLAHVSEDILPPSSIDCIRRAIEVYQSANPPAITKAYKTFMALQSLGKPSHFSQIFDEYCKLYPDDVISVQFVHSMLSSFAQPGVERYGVVWVGAKGMYALSDWGYKRPPRPLFETVANVVQTVFKSTGLPVSVDVIREEVFKDHPLIQESSFVIAVSMNDGVVKHTDGKYLPASVGDIDINTDMQSIRNFPWVILLYSKEHMDEDGKGTVFATIIPNGHVMMREDDWDLHEYIGSFAGKWSSDDEGYRQWIASGSHEFLQENQEIFGYSSVNVDQPEMPIAGLYWHVLRRYNNSLIGSYMLNVNEAQRVLSDAGWEFASELYDCGFSQSSAI